MNKRSGLAAKDVIIDRATTLFAEKGYHEATIRDIARATGMALGSIHYYFRSKEAILKTVISRGTGGNSLSEAIAAEPRPIEERLRSVIEHLVETNLKSRDKCWVLIHEMRYLSPEARNSLQRSLKERRRIVERLIVEGTEAGVFQADDPAFVALNLVEMINSIALWYRIDGSRSPEEIVDGIVNFVFNGLLTRDRVDSQR